MVGTNAPAEDPLPAPKRVGTVHYEGAMFTVFRDVVGSEFFIDRYGTKIFPTESPQFAGDKLPQPALAHIKVAVGPIALAAFARSRQAQAEAGNDGKAEG